MSLLADHQTGSYWDHITGECVHGPLKGRKLDLEPLRHMRTDQALAQFPDARIASSRMLLPFGLVARIMDIYGKLLGKGRFVPPMLLRTMGVEDQRRARMDLGLGVWSDGASRYYPLEILKARGGVLFDRFDGREMLIYLDSISGTPTPLFVDVQEAEWEGEDLRLDNGGAIRNGRLYDANGVELPVERPLHLFNRWFGFSLTFPKCEVYGTAGGTAGVSG